MSAQSELTIPVDGQKRNLQEELERIFSDNRISVVDGSIAVDSRLDREYPTLNCDVLASMFADNLADVNQTVTDYLRWHRQRQPAFAPSIAAHLLSSSMVDFARQVELTLDHGGFQRYHTLSATELTREMETLIHQSPEAATDGHSASETAIKVAALASLLYERTLNPALFA